MIAKKRWRCCDAVSNGVNCWRTLLESCLTDHTKHVCLRSCEIDAFSQEVSTFPGIFSLCFHCLPTIPQLQSLLMNCASTRQLRMLDFGGTNLSSTFVPLLIDVCRLHSIEVLNLSGNHIGGAVIDLCHFFASEMQTTLHTLHLSNNNFEGKRVWDAVCLLIQRLPCLHSISVVNNWCRETITRKHIDDLQQCISDNRCLKRLHFGGCFKYVSEYSFHYDFAKTISRCNLNFVELSLDYGMLSLLDSCCKRNRELLALNPIATFICGRFSALVSLSLPLYTLLNILDWFLFVEQGAYFDDRSHFAPIDLVEQHLAPEKVRLLLKMCEFYRKRHPESYSVE